MGKERVQILAAYGYAGWPFFGVAPQPELPTAGEALLNRLEQALGVRPRALAIAARTDAGVHADLALSTCHIEQAELPGDLSLASSPREDGLLDVRTRVVGPHVHARALCAAKRYTYRVQDGLDEEQAARAQADLGHHGRAVTPDPGPAGRAWQVAGRLDHEAMALAATHLVGTHDFSALRGRRGRQTSPVKTLTSVVVTREEDHIRIDVEGDAFLRKQIRRMASLLVAIGRGDRSPGSVPDLLATRDPRQAEWPAPARGLTLAGLQLRTLTGLRWAHAPSEVRGSDFTPAEHEGWSAR